MPGKATPPRAIAEVYQQCCFALLMARYCYYCLAKPLYSDAEYDAMEDQLRAFEEANQQMIHPNSPTRRPGSDLPYQYPPSVRAWVDRAVAKGEVVVKKSGVKNLFRILGNSSAGRARGC